MEEGREGKAKVAGPANGPLSAGRTPSEAVDENSSSRTRGGTDGHSDDASAESRPTAVPEAVERADVPPQGQSKLGNLHQRRAHASPEKFHTARFEALPLHAASSRADGPSPAKRARTGTNVEIEYDASGTPRVAQFTPSATSIPTGRWPPGKSFSLIQAFCSRNDLLLLLVSFLNLPSFISLYSISRTFHALFNRNHTAFVLANMRTWAPNADRIYPWRYYASLCVKDPILKQKSRLKEREELSTLGEFQNSRDVPTLRWLQMVVWRECVCTDMLIQLATKGFRCPPGTLDAVKRMWFMLDLPLNAQRLALVRSEAYISDEVMHHMTLFMLKIDMCFTDPVPPRFPRTNPMVAGWPERFTNALVSGVSLRKTLLAERHLTCLWRVLHGWSWDPALPQVPLTQLDMLRLWVRHHFKLPANAPLAARQQSIMSIPWNEVGQAGLERTTVASNNLAGGGCEKGRGRFKLDPQLDAPTTPADSHPKHPVLEQLKPRAALLRPDQLILGESLRRSMKLHEKWVSMMLWGFCDEVGYQIPLRSENELLRLCRRQPRKSRWDN